MYVNERLVYDFGSDEFSYNVGTTLDPETHVHVMSHQYKNACYRTNVCLQKSLNIRMISSATRFLTCTRSPPNEPYKMSLTRFTLTNRKPSDEIAAPYPSVRQSIIGGEFIIIFVCTNSVVAGRPRGKSPAESSNGKPTTVSHIYTYPRVR